MRSFFSRRIVIAGIIFVLLVVGLLIYAGLNKKPLETPIKAIEAPKVEKYKIIGTSVQKRNIESYTYGKGDIHLLFAGGMHGGYEWNSVLLAYKFMDYLDANPDAVPANVTVTIIPSLNPDAVFVVTGKEGRFAVGDVSKNKQTLASARFNANKVDLNRNFDCKWKPTSTWQSKIVSAGTEPFSEPEAAALRDYVSSNKLSAAIFWHSQANAVYASECKNGILPQTLDIMNTYSKAAGYTAVKSFDAYPVTGDSEGWLASVGVPAITVELKTHETIEWEKNLAGIKALFKYYSEKR